MHPCHRGTSNSSYFLSLNLQEKELRYILLMINYIYTESSNSVSKSV